MSTKRRRTAAVVAGVLAGCGLVAAGGEAHADGPGPAPSFAAATVFPIGADPTTVRLGDVNGDGKLDIVGVAADMVVVPPIDYYFSASVLVSLGNGAGRFAPSKKYAIDKPANSLVLGDVNGDRKLDIVIAGQSSDVGVLLGKGDGRFGALKRFATGRVPLQLVLGDVNGDRKLDIVAPMDGSASVALLLGNGAGGFRAPTYLGILFGDREETPNAVALGDVNGDRKLDIVTGNSPRVNSSEATASVFIGNGAGGFSDPKAFTIGNSSWSVQLADINGDRRLDIVSLGQGPTVSLLPGNGAGGFGAHTMFDWDRPVIWGAVYWPLPQVVDVNGDSKLDLLGHSWDPKTGASATVSLGDGAGGFGAITRFPVGVRFSDEPVLGDVNGDSRPDIVLANHGYEHEHQKASVSVLLNRTRRPIGTPALQATPGNGKVTLAWAVPRSDGPVITGYKVYYRLRGDRLWRGSGTVASPGATVTGLTNGRTYDFGVVAVAAGGAHSEMGVTGSTPMGILPLAVSGARPADRALPLSGPTIVIGSSATSSRGAVHTRVSCGLVGATSQRADPRYCRATVGANGRVTITTLGHPGVGVTVRQQSVPRPGQTGYQASTVWTRSWVTSTS